MLSFFRRVLSSWVAVAILGVVMVAFIITGVSTPGGNGMFGGQSEADVARVGSAHVTAAEIATRLNGQLRSAQQQQPGATMAQLLASAGGLDAVVNQTIGGRLMTEWARRYGITANERLIGGQIATIPAFQGPTGNFDQRVMQAVLAQQRISMTSLHDDIRDDLIRRQILTPITASTHASLGLSTPYAALLLDRREGVIGTIAARRDGLPAPTDADIGAWYRAHIASYSLPERRVLRYALLGPENVQVAAPTEAEIAAAYKADSAKYAASETRQVSRVVLPDEAAARAFAAKAKAAPFAKAAADAGFSAKDISVGSVTREALAAATSPAIASAVYALPRDGTTAPIKTDLGWTVAHVDALVSTPARSLDSVRGEITEAISKKKRAEGASILAEKIQNAVDGGATFDEVVKQNKLVAVTTPALLANGHAPAVPAYQPDATVTALLKTAFDAAPDDDPTIETVGQDQHAALLVLGSVEAPAPVPLDQIRPRVTEDMIASRAADRAKAQAQAILAQLNKGVAPAAAFAAAGLPAPQAAAATQLQLSQMQSGAPAPMRALFRLTVGRNEIVPMPGGNWFVVHLDRIVPGDKTMLPPIVRGVQADLTRSLGEEYAEQFANAARADVKVTKNPAGIAALAKQLSGASQNQ